MEGCDQCQRIKNRVKMPAGKLRPKIVLEKPQQNILVDFITKLLVSRDHDSILIVCNMFSKNQKKRKEKSNQEKQIKKEIKSK